MILPLLIAGLLSFWSNRNRPPEVSSVVVLPAKVFGASDLAYLTDAVPGTLSTHLAGVQGLETKVPPTSIEFDKSGGDYNKIADAYGVNVLVLSAITADAGILQLNLQVIDPRTRRVIWSNPYQGPRGKYLELVQAAGEGLRRALKPASSPAATAAGRAANSEAELAFRKGEHFRDRFNDLHQAGDFDVALAAFKRALELDPKLADAAAEISRLYLMKLDATGPTPELISEIENWARKALDANPRCGRAYFTLASAEQWRPHGDIRKVLAHGLHGASLAPQYAPSHTMVAVGLAGSLALSLEATREARRIDPLYLYASTLEAGTLNQPGRPAEALELIENSVLNIEPGMNYDAAFRLIQRAIQGGLTLPYDMLRLNPRLEVLRKDPRFQPILVQSREQFDQMMLVLDEARSRGELPGYLEKPLTDLRVRLGR